MPITAELHIDQPPTAEWREDRMRIKVTTGDVSYVRVLTRHAAVGLLMELQRELAKQDNISPRELCERVAKLGH